MKNFLRDTLAKRYKKRRMIGNLRDYDVAELLLLLAEGGRSGVFEVTHPLGVFRLRLSRGRVLDAVFGVAREDAALALLLRDSQGSFVFTPREMPREVPGGPARCVAAALLAALRFLPPPPLPFEGPAKLKGGFDSASLDLTQAERRALNEVSGGRPLADFEDDPEAHRAVARLARLGVLTPRRVRVARLKVGVWRGGAGKAALDQGIAVAWAQQLGRFGGEVQLRTDAGRVHRVPAMPTANLGPHLLLSPETLLRLGLRSGQAVLVRPAE